MLRGCPQCRQCSCCLVVRPCPPGFSSSSVRSEGSFYFDDDLRVHGNGRGRAPKNPSRVSVQLFGDRSDPRLFVAKKEGKSKVWGPDPAVSRVSPPHLQTLLSLSLYTRVLGYFVPSSRSSVFFIYIYIYYDEVSEEKIFYALVFAVGGMPRGGWCHARRPSNLVPIYCSYHCPWWSYGYVCMLHVGRGGGVILIRRKHQKEKKIILNQGICPCNHNITQHTVIPSVIASLPRSLHRHALNIYSAQFMIMGAFRRASVEPGGIPEHPHQPRCSLRFSVTVTV
ncbi:hypothetical protein BGY98DRAFT_417671 [Russula aff. rugulosa BPL654]|nr:hypothetical protein BGY98DRAFT_417671 [Russula aff. rugulosa BPL654]